MAQLGIDPARLEQLRDGVPGVHEFDGLAAEAGHESLPEILAWPVSDDHGEVVWRTSAQRLPNRERGHTGHDGDCVVANPQVPSERAFRVAFERQHPSPGGLTDQLARELPGDVLGDVGGRHSSHHFRWSFLSG